MIKRSFILILCIVLLTGGSAVAEYEQQIRIELNDKMGMPLSAEKDYEEDLYHASEYDPYETDRMVYTAGFHETDGDMREWSARMDPATGKLISAWVTLDDRYYRDDDNYMVSDMRQDPWEPRWEKMAAEAVSALRADGGKGIVQVQSQGNSPYCWLQCVKVNVLTEDGWQYQVYIAYIFGHVIIIDYYDPIYMAAREALMEESRKSDKEGDA